MKSILNTAPEDKIKHTFPALYKDTESSLVVLATGEHSGTVVCSGSGWGLAQHTSAWASFTKDKSWQRLHAGSSVTLTQE